MAALPDPAPGLAPGDPQPVGDRLGHPPGSTEDPAGAALTQRQRQVLYLRAHGLRSAEIAARLGLSPQTVKHHLSETYAQLGARTAPHAVYLWLTGRRGARACRRCGQPAPHGRSRYCGDECMRIAQEERGRAGKLPQPGWVPTAGRDCAWCGLEAVGPGRVRFCSADCLRRATQERQNEAQRARRRAAKR